MMYSYCSILVCLTTLLLVSDEGVYVNSSGGQLKDSRLQWGEVPSSIGELG